MNNARRLVPAWMAVLLLGLLVVGLGAGPSGEAPEPLYKGLGAVSHKITTTFPEAQRYFDQGLALMYGFNHDEAIRSFTQAATLDPSCAMAMWGVALANGPHINNPVLPPDRGAAAWTALTRAKALAGGASPVERALIDALAARYADPPPDDRAALDRAYADAMAGVWKAYPEDADVGALYAEALMDLHPWDLWTHDGAAQPWTPEIVAVLESVLKLAPKHPLANHLYIHAVEASPDPGKADRAADTLRDLVPGSGHLVHMPSHIDVRRGRWFECITANAKAMEADRRYTSVSPEQGFYRLYMAHNHHMLTYGAMMTGQSALAITTIRAMVDDIPEAFWKENAFVDGFRAMPFEVLMRFGKWDEILAEPLLPEYVPIARALQHYARAVALAAKNDVTGARKEAVAFGEARTRVSEEATFGNNPGRQLLGVAEALMDGEILYRSGKKDEGIARLREAVVLEDALRYDEPPDWIQPIRHPLGAALLQSGKFAEAEAVFREDLARLPENGWGLYGLLRSLELQKKDDEARAVKARFDAVWKEADLKIQSPCLCLPGV